MHVQQCIITVDNWCFQIGEIHQHGTLIFIGTKYTILVTQNIIQCMI